ncbi:MAG: hypothetical protein A2V65_06860 [Deltaproteobacteria bacterium RBG_13_49_15]|nr:MAG: hypothetical protein A2V65_06860 [Deltaproteobacteria bacterium RBG_13_49_15]
MWRDCRRICEFFPSLVACLYPLKIHPLLKGRSGKSMNLKMKINDIDTYVFIKTLRKYQPVFSVHIPVGIYIAFYTPIRYLTVRKYGRLEHPCYSGKAFTLPSGLNNAICFGVLRSLQENRNGFPSSRRQPWL